MALSEPGWLSLQIRLMLMNAIWGGALEQACLREQSRHEQMVDTAMPNKGLRAGKAEDTHTKKHVNK